MSTNLRMAVKSNSINEKIIEPLKDGGHVIGPGQMATPLAKKIVNGVKLSSRKRRKHTDSQSDQQSLDEMLADPNSSINYGNADVLVNGTSGVPTTGNLVNLLVQGLKSQNVNMLSTVLDRHDISFIRETIYNLPNEMVEDFVKILHKLFYSKGDKLIHYYKWLTTLLQQKLSIILMSQSAQEELASLKTLFSSRCDNFDRVCALRGRLSLISSLMEPNNEEHKSINYQESSSDEEAEEEDANSSDQDSEDRDLERIIVMDLSDAENNSGAESDGDDDDDEDNLDVDDVDQVDSNDDNESNAFEGMDNEDEDEDDVDDDDDDDVEDGDDEDDEEDISNSKHYSKRR